MTLHYRKPLLVIYHLYELPRSHMVPVFVLFPQALRGLVHCVPVLTILRYPRRRHLYLHSPKVYHYQI